MKGPRTTPSLPAWPTTADARARRSHRGITRLPCPALHRDLSTSTLLSRRFAPCLSPESARSRDTVIPPKADMDRFSPTSILQGHVSAEHRPYGLPSKTRSNRRIQEAGRHCSHHQRAASRRALDGPRVGAPRNTNLRELSTKSIISTPTTPARPGGRLVGFLTSTLSLTASPLVFSFQGPVLSSTGPPTESFRATTRPPDSVRYVSVCCRKNSFGKSFTGLTEKTAIFFVPLCGYHSLPRLSGFVFRPPSFSPLCHDREPR